MMRLCMAHGFGLRAFALFVVILGWMSSFSLVVWAAPVVPVELADEYSASAAARRFDKPVKVASKTTESSEVVANPNGTFTLSRTVQPTRVQRGGGWVPLDLGLRKQVDGSVAPAAANVDLRLAGAGSGKSLVVLARGGREVGLGWDGVLPEPVLDRETATYPGVMPGVDLVITVGGTGFSQVLRVKSAEAAKNPKLRKVTFGSHAKGVRVSKVGSGLEARDASGNLVFVGDASQMWDSSDSKRMATMGVTVTDNQISVSPAEGFLVDPATRYPVFIDPSYHWAGGKNHHVVTQSWPYGDTRNYDRTSSPMEDLKAGYVPGENGLVSRSYVEMYLADVAGKRIHSAFFRTTVVNSYSCSGGPTDIYSTTGIGPGTTWNNPPWRPQYGQDGGNRRSNNPRYCPSDGIAEFNVYPAVSLGAQNRQANVTFGLFARNEGSQEDWRRFALNPTLQVMYNSYPNPPSDHGMEGGLIPCVVGEARPYVFTRTPRLRVRVSDPDGGVLGTRFVLHRGPSGSSVQIADYYRHDTPSGSFAEVTVAAGAINTEGVYSWGAQAEDGEDTSNWQGRSCDFSVDNTPPGLPVVNSEEYPSSDPAGGVGVTGTFELQANNTPDVVHYLYSFTDQQNDDPTTRVDANGLGGKATIRWTPTLRGTQTLFVRSVDRAGNKSAIYRYQVNVLPGAGPVGSWKLDGDLADGSGNERPLAAVGGATATAEGYSGKAGGFDGADDYLSRSVMVDTSKSFSVSAWARLDQVKNGWSGVMAAEGLQTSSFYLQHSVANRWEFAFSTSDTSGSGNGSAFSPDTPLVGVWTHLVGVYDSATSKISLYVDGVRKGEAVATLWQASGNLVVGRQKIAGRFDYFPGQIDEPRVYDRAVSATEAAALANQSAPRAYYALNEGTGTTTKDEVTGRLGTLNGTASWATDEYTTVKLDGSAGAFITAPKPEFRTDRSFTVSAWVRAGAFGPGARVAVSMNTATTAPFFLGAWPGTMERWGFVQSTEPVGTGAYAAWSTAEALPDKWVHLTGVFDAPGRELRLYVNGQFVSRERGPHVDGWNAPGDLLIGRTMWNGNATDNWSGSIDDVKVFAGALTDAEIRRQLVRD